MKELYTLVLMFYIYSFLGWVLEVIVGVVQKKGLINRGFLIGPICPIYGCGGVLIFLLLSKYASDPLVFFLMSIILCAILEYFTSYLMEKIFKNRWWDYSDVKFNINGRICLECAVPFGIGALIIYYGLNPLIIAISNLIPLTLIKITAITLLLVTLVDIILSFNIIINLKNISNNIRYDSTELITKKVREILSDKNALHRRLINSFPDMRISNKLSILKEKMTKDKEKIKKEKERLKKQKRTAKKRRK